MHTLPAAPVFTTVTLVLTKGCPGLGLAKGDRVVIRDGEQLTAVLPSGAMYYLTGKLPAGKAKLTTAFDSAIVLQGQVEALAHHPPACPPLGGPAPGTCPAAGPGRRANKPSLTPPWRTTMSTYENAPSTILLATDCAACNRPLRDAASVEAGMGPDCRKKYGYGAAQRDADWAQVEQLLIDAAPGLFAATTAHWGDARKVANVVVHHAACAPRGERGLHVQLVAALGYDVLSRALARGAGEVVEVHVRGESYAVRTPYNPAFNEGLKARRVGARWDRTLDLGGKRPGAWVVPGDAGAKRGLFAALKEAFAGAMLLGPKGVVQL